MMPNQNEVPEKPTLHQHIWSLKEQTPGYQAYIGLIPLRKTDESYEEKVEGSIRLSAYLDFYCWTQHRITALMREIVRLASTPEVLQFLQPDQDDKIPALFRAELTLRLADNAKDQASSDLFSSLYWLRQANYYYDIVLQQMSSLSSTYLQAKQFSQMCLELSIFSTIKKLLSQRLEYGQSEDQAVLTQIGRIVVAYRSSSSYHEMRVKLKLLTWKPDKYNLYKSLIFLMVRKLLSLDSKKEVINLVSVEMPLLGCAELAKGLAEMYWETPQDAAHWYWEAAVYYLRTKEELSGFEYANVLSSDKGESILRLDEEVYRMLIKATQLNPEILFLSSTGYPFSYREKLKQVMSQRGRGLAPLAIGELPSSSYPPLYSYSGAFFAKSEQLERPTYSFLPS